MNTDLINIVMIIALTACVYMLYKELSAIENEILNLKKFVYGERVIPITNLFQQQPKTRPEPSAIFNVINDTLMKEFNADNDIVQKETECKITELPIQPIEEKEIEQDFIDTNIVSTENTE